jgi:hypothetical protein
MNLWVAILDALGEVLRRNLSEHGDRPGQQRPSESWMAR